MLYLYNSIYIYIKQKYVYTYIYQASNHHYKNYLPVIKRDLLENQKMEDFQLLCCPPVPPQKNDRPGGRSREAYGGGRCAADGGCQR